MPLVTRLADRGSFFRQALEPTNWLDGDMWVDTDNANLFVNNSGTAVQAGVGSLGAANTVVQVNSAGTGLEHGKVAILNIADGTDGEIISWDSNGVATAIGAGTSGQFLQSGGAGAEPVFATVVTTPNFFSTTNGGGVPVNVTGWFPMYGPSLNRETDEDLAGCIMAAAGTWSLLSVNIDTNTASVSTVITSRIDKGAGSQTLTFTTTVTGTAQDTTNSDAVSNLNLINYQVAIPAGTGSIDDVTYGSQYV